MSYRSDSPPSDSVWQRLLIVCPLLVLANDAIQAAAFAVAACVVLAASNIGIFAIRGFVPEHVRLPAFALVIGLFATTAALLMQAFVFDLTERLALFAAIIVVISTNLAHAARPTSRAWGRVLFDTVAICQAFGVALVALGIAAGTLPPAATAPAVFVIAGLSLAAKSALRGTA